jgi:hypothetical protein
MNGNPPVPPIVIPRLTCKELNYHKDLMGWRTFLSLWKETCPTAMSPVF